MNELTLFFLCEALSLGGISIGLYKVTAEDKIRQIVKNGTERGYNIDSDNDQSYFVSRLNKWTVGQWFDSNSGVLTGMALWICGGLINLIQNSFWTSSIIWITSYVLFHFFIAVLKSAIQLASITLLLVTVILMLVYLI